MLFGEGKSFWNFITPSRLFQPPRWLETRVWYSTPHQCTARIRNLTVLIILSFQVLWLTNQGRWLICLKEHVFSTCLWFFNQLDECYKWMFDFIHSYSECRAEGDSYVTIQCRDFYIMPTGERRGEQRKRSVQQLRKLVKRATSF